MNTHTYAYIFAPSKIKNVKTGRRSTIIKNDLEIYKMKNVHNFVNKLNFHYIKTKNL